MDRNGLVEPRIISAETPLASLNRALATGEADLFLVEHGGRRYLLDRSDIERVSPSPASSLARYETAERIARLRAGHALREPATEVPTGATTEEVAAAVAAAGWRPVLVRDGTRWLAASPITLVRGMLHGAVA
ncbi:MAG: hypothetical protein AMXMBFR23_09520 [Chloroflexota bacterium]